MGANSKIEWCDHTVNLWWGCYEVNKACDNCYAKTLANRYHGPDLLWEQQGPRMYIKSAMSDLRKYQATAAKLGITYRVFMNSMSDLFEKSMPVVDFKHEPMFFEDRNAVKYPLETEALRHNFFIEVEKCPNLFFILLTKRPSNIVKMIPEKWLNNPPSNVIYITSCPDQESLDTLLPQLLKVPGKHGLSLEPMIGPIDLKMTKDHGNEIEILPNGSNIQWVICGGESGSDKGVRPMHPDWARSIRDQCVTAGVPFFFKQWGEYMPVSFFSNDKNVIWFNRESPEYHYTVQPRMMAMFGDEGRTKAMQKVGKKEAGAVLDGKTWKEFPR